MSYPYSNGSNNRRPRDLAAPSVPHYTVKTTTYTADLPSNYYARLSEKAAPSGTIHLNGYEDEAGDSYYRPPVYVARPVERRVVREVVTKEVVEGRYSEPVKRVVHEKVVKDVETGSVKEKVAEERSVKGIAGKGLGAVWKALGGQERR